MADQPIRLTPLGNLDKDSDYNLVKEGNYVDALDVIKQDDDGQVSGSIQPTQRNKHAFSLGEVVAQNKKYRITVPSTAGRYAVRFQSANGANDIVDYNGPIAYSDVPSTAVQFYSLANWQAEGWTVQDTANSALFNTTYPTVNGQTVIELELNAYQYYDYVLTSVGPDTVKVECIQEAIPTDLVGPLKDIGSFDFLGDLFIFSTTQDNDSEETNLEVSGVGPIANIGGQDYYVGLTTISFTTDHNLQVGQGIIISGSNLGFLNGYFVVNSVLAPNQITVVTSTAWGDQFLVTSGAIGEEKITIHPKGIGEIGVAQKDNQSETWTYTRLLRSWELNYRLKHAIRSDAREKLNRKILYYTDYLNDVRSISYQGEYVEDGLLTFVNELNFFSYDNITKESNLFSSQSILLNQLSFETVGPVGGQLNCGNYYFTYRFYIGESPTSWVSINESGIPIIPEAFPDDSPINIHGDSSDITTSKVINLTLNNINSNLYDRVEFAVVYVAGDGQDIAFDSWIWQEYYINEETTLSLTFTGLEDRRGVDLGEISFSQSNTAIPRKAYDLCIIDERLVLGNIKYSNIQDLSDWADQLPVPGRHRLGDPQPGTCGCDWRCSGCHSAPGHLSGPAGSSQPCRHAAPCPARTRDNPLERDCGRRHCPLPGSIAARGRLVPGVARALPVVLWDGRPDPVQSRPAASRGRRVTPTARTAHRLMVVSSIWRA